MQDIPVGKGEIIRFSFLSPVSFPLAGTGQRDGGRQDRKNMHIRIWTYAHGDTDPFRPKYPAPELTSQIRAWYLGKEHLV